jgi:hypothetical protein
MTSTFDSAGHPRPIDQQTLARLMRDGPAQARAQELQGGVMALVAFVLVLSWSLWTQ